MGAQAANSCFTTFVLSLTPNCGAVFVLVQVRLLLLAAMSGEHILLIGPPGTAKSEVGRRMNKLISGTFFERLLTRFSVPEVRGGRKGAEWFMGIGWIVYVTLI
jgi:hypothetical protein